MVGNPNSQTRADAILAAKPSYREQRQACIGLACTDV